MDLNAMARELGTATGSTTDNQATEDGTSGPN
jgi:hypothetical protein